MCGLVLERPKSDSCALGSGGRDGEDPMVKLGDFGLSKARASIIMKLHLCMHACMHAYMHVLLDAEDTRLLPSGSSSVEN